MIKVYLDVGHGGAEPSMEANGLKEKDVNLAVAIRVREILIAEGLDVMLSRNTDVTLADPPTYPTAIDASAAKCNAWKPDAAYSIHHNGLDGEGGADPVGYDLFYSDFRPPSLAMANAIGEEFNAAGRPKHSIQTKTYVENGVKYDYYGIMRQITVCPVVLIEYCYMDTPSEAQLVNTKEGTDREAMQIARGILRFFGLQMPVEKPATIPEIKMTLAEALTVLTKKGLLPEMEAFLVKVAQNLK